MTVFVTLMVTASIVAMVARRFKLPYALALVVTGLAIGFWHLMPQAQLDPQTLFTLFLPPLLFEASINLPGGQLRADWKPIGAFALVGTILSTGLVGAAVAWGFGIPLPVALVFGALISPTDPISVIAVLKQLGVNPRLALIVEAESLFNDGVAVVVFLVLLGSAMGQDATVLGVVGRFAWVMLGGIAVGGLVGWAASRATKDFDDHLLEIMLTTIVAFGAYLLAEAMHVSGVIAVVAGGLVVGNYGMRTAMSEQSRVAVHAFWEYAAFVVNSIVFLLIGIQACQVAWWTHWELVLGATAAIMAARAICIYGLALPLKAVGAGLPPSWQHLLVWGSLRGALSMALALGLPPAFPFREQVISMTFGYVLFSLLAQGLTVGKLITRLGLKAVI
ncbi:MAG: Na+ antiporter [Cyanobacteria bacterium RYN_339]|nr:Na+ antiporter [Cyanobacteria bacterium RYN_339]